MGIKKRRRELAEALHGLFLSDADRKALKKTKKLSAFIRKLRHRREILAKEASRAANAELTREVAFLDTQILRAEQLLQAMEEKKRRKAEK